MHNGFTLSIFNGPAHEDEHLHHGPRFAEETQGFYLQEVQDYAGGSP